MFLDAKHTKILLTLNSSQIQLHRHSIKQAVWPPDSADMVCPCPSVTLTYDCLTLKLVCELHLRWGTFTPKFGMLGLLVLEIFAMYATDGQTDRCSKATLIPPCPTVGGTTTENLNYMQYILLQHVVVIQQTCLPTQKMTVCRADCRLLQLTKQPLVGSISQHHQNDSRTHHAALQCQCTTPIKQ